MIFSTCGAGWISRRHPLYSYLPGVLRLLVLLVLVCVGGGGGGVFVWWWLLVVLLVLFVLFCWMREEIALRCF